MSVEGDSPANWRPNSLAKSEPGEVALAFGRQAFKPSRKAIDARFKAGVKGYRLHAV